MKTVGTIAAINMKAQVPVNGVETVYRFEIVPELIISSGDSLYITWPSEAELPSSYYVECSAVGDLEVDYCTKVGSDTLRIVLTEVDEHFNPSDAFYLYVYGCVNPVSLKPSSPFNSIKLVSRYGNDIASYYDSNLVIQTEETASFSSFSLS